MTDKFILLVNKFNGLNSLDIDYLKDEKITHSEVHFLDLMSRNPDKKASELAELSGVTKGAISQQIKKLEKKGLLIRVRYNDNYKEVFISLTAKGNEAVETHNKFDNLMLKDLNTLLNNMPAESEQILMTIVDTLIVTLGQAEKKANEGFFNSK